MEDENTLIRDIISLDIRLKE